MSNFIDERLLEYVAYGFEGGPTFRTTAVELASGWEQRNAERLRPLHRFSAPYDSIKEEYHEILKAAHIACLGKLRSFRFKDWSDYKLDDAVIGTTDGNTDQVVQLIKPYTFGNVTVERPLSKPCDSTKYSKANGYVEDAPALVVTADDVPITFSVDYDTGLLTITESAGQTLRATCHFDVPVGFDDDFLSFAVVNYKAHSGQVSLKEDFRA